MSLRSGSTSLRIQRLALANHSSTNYEMKFSIIICTKDRPKDLATVLNSIKNQTVMPFEVLIVDGSDNSVEQVANSFMETLPLRYFYLRPPGLTRQRNFGISHVNPEAEWVGFLDDDLVLDPECLENLERFLKISPKFAGVGLRIYEQPALKKSWSRELMLLDRYPGGLLTKAGSPAQIRAFDSDTQTEWIYGGATFWRKEILSQFRYDEWFSGVGYFEDVDFSYSVSRQFPLAICAGARCHHYHHEVPVEKMMRLGEWLVLAWWYFARIKNKFGLIPVLWGIFWMSMSNLVVGLLKKDQRRLNAFKGNLKGWGKLLSNGVVSSKGFQK
jgi:glycosyltransferase involved in cell wall biosynthesis